MPRSCLIPLLLVLLAGCEKVEFQSPPGALVDCDPQFVGNWKVINPEEDRDDDDSVMYLRVTDQCAQWLGVEVDSDDTASVKVEDLVAKMSLGFARTQQHQFVVSRDLSEPDPAPSAQPEGYVLAAYQRVGDALELRLLDPRKTANRIVDGVIPGWVEKRDRAADGRIAPLEKRFYVYVFGSPEETAQLLDAHAKDLLESPWVRLQPVDEGTAARIERWTADGPTQAGKP